MKNNELRIGNWLFDDSPNDRGYFQIQGGGIAHMEDEYKPIPLTEEWLLKFGITKISDCNYAMELYRNGETFYVGKGKDVHRWDGTLWVPEEMEVKKNRVIHWVTPKDQMELFVQDDTDTRMVPRGKVDPKSAYFRIHTL